ncbi:MAG: acyl-CoA thioesterase [Sphingobacteriales bacterium]
MNVFYEGQVLWSQIDANQHMRHSAYADFGAQARLTMMESLGLDLKALLKYNIGPVLFREELFYTREVGINDRIQVSCELIKSRADGSRWTMRHEIFRNDGIKASTIIVEGAWIDLEKRKLAALPAELMQHFMNSPKGKDYMEEQVKPKN